jgi:hypothetical protein
MAALAHGVPAMFLLPVDRGRHREIRGRVARPLVLVAAQERAVRPEPPTDDQRLDRVLELPPRVEEARPFGRAQPLVASSCVVVGAERVEIEGDVPGSVGAVHDRHEPSSAGPPHDLGDGEDQRRGRGDVTDKDRTCALGDVGKELLDDR